MAIPVATTIAENYGMTTTLRRRLLRPAGVATVNRPPALSAPKDNEGLLTRHAPGGGHRR
jgi:hypothetical protein